ncbi:MAG: MotA/TolQ/ExbB proton channel family protein [Verrucomicrobiae bacterium]|nr:MotA/TolQ/ExbB proton channel family protein [Verrucomicrobiae bacterium]
MTPDFFSPLLASGALQFAFEKATLEGKITIGTLVIVSLFSWTVILSKARQLWIARREGRRFFAAYRAERDPLELSRKDQAFDGAPAYSLYLAGALIATVIGLLVAIPAMFAYNFMVTSIRAITQELDNFASEYATALEHAYVDNRPLAEELSEANRLLAEKIEDSNDHLGDRIIEALRGRKAAVGGTD